MVYSQQEDMKSQLAERMTALLTPMPHPEQADAMSKVVNLLETNGFPVADPSQTSPQAFSQDLFLSGALSKLVANAIKIEFKPADVDNPEELVSTLLPSDGHLD